MKFTLEANHKAALEKLANSSMTPVVIAQRAKILLLKALGKSAAAIADKVNVSGGRGRKEEIIGEAMPLRIRIHAEPVVSVGHGI